MEEDQALYIPSMGKGCGLISHVTDPVLVRKSGKMFGFWTRDNGDLDHKSVFVMEHFYKNTKMDKYRSMSGNETKVHLHGQLLVVSKSNFRINLSFRQWSKRKCFHVAFSMGGNWSSSP